MVSINTMPLFPEIIMSEVTAEQMDQLIDAINRMTPSFNKGVLGKNDQEEKKRANTLRSLDRNMQDFDRNIRRVSSSAEGAIETLGSFAQWGKGPLGLGVFTVLAARGMALSKSWQQMMNTGNSFNGSMLNMLNSAAGAGLSLDQYVDIQRKYNVLINSGGKDFLGMQKELRRNISAAGSYGMTVEQVNEFLGEHLEVSRKNGSLNNRTNKQLIKDMQGLALTTNALAKSSDKTVEEITKLAAAATSSALAMAQTRLTPAALRGMVDRNMKEATAVFASLPGQAGEFMSNFFTDSFGGMAVLTQQGETMINAGLSGLVAGMDSTAQKFRDGQGTMEDALEYNNRFIDAVDENLPALRAQAIAGNEAAKQMIAMHSEMRKMTKLEIEANKRRAKNAKRFTAFAASLESIYSMLVGSFKTGFIGKFNSAMEGVFGPMDDLANSETFIKLQEAVGKTGEWLGDFFGSMLKNMDADQLVKMFTSGIQGLADFTKAVVWVASGFTSVVSGLSTVVGGFLNLVGRIEKALNLSEGSFTKWLAIGGAAFLTVKKVGSMFGRFAANMNVRAGVVNILGGVGGASGGILDMLLGGKRGKGGWAAMKARAKVGRRAGGLMGMIKGGAQGLFGRGGRGIAAAATTAAAETAASSGGLLGGLAGKVGAKGVGKSLLKKLPVIGLLAGLGFGASSLLAGDWKGAGLEVASGAASMIPGVGTAASIGIDALNMSRQAENMANADAQSSMASPKMAEPIQGLGRAMSEHSDMVARKLDAIATKLDRAISLLSKIDVSAQNM